MSFIGVDPSAGTKIKALTAKLAKFTDLSADTAVQSSAEETLKAMQEYAEEKRVTRKEAYGVSFFTPRQRRFFFWAKNNGIINVPYNRTNTLKRGWAIVRAGTKQAKVVNFVSYADTVMGQGQNRMHKLIGWQTVEERQRGAVEKFVRRIGNDLQKLVKKLGL